MPLRALLCGLLLALAGSAGAQSLSPLRVDPSLLGGAPAEKKDKPAETSATKPEAAPADKTSAKEAPRTDAARPAATAAPATPAKPLALDAPQKLESEDAPAEPRIALPPAAPVRKAPPAKKSSAVKSDEAQASEVPKADLPSTARDAAPPSTAAPAQAAPVVVPAAATAASPAPVAAVPAIPAIVAPSAPQLATAQSVAPPRPYSLEATRTAGGASMPPLRVDPALLAPPRPSAPTQLAAAPSATASAGARPAPPGRPVDAVAPQLLGATEPPQVGERPELPPLYSAYAAAGELPLKAAKGLTPLPSGSEVPRPTFIAADRIRGTTDIETIADGNAELRRAGSVVTADRLAYWHIDDEVEALGNVRYQRDRDVVSGPRVRMRIDESVGFAEQPNYEFTRQVKAPSLPGTLQGSEPPPRMSITARGQAERIDFEGEGLMRLFKTTYSTCAPPSSDWQVEVDRLTLDYDADTGEGRDAKIVFMGVPLLYTPWIEFPLSSNRKTGLLAPTFGSSSKTGVEITQPWYWNIAPNMDATIAPRYMAKRGTQIKSEFRYLDHDYFGEISGEYLPGDRMFNNQRRSVYVVNHTHLFGRGFAGSLFMNGVSDDSYFSDLSTRLASISQGNLLRRGVLSYSGGGWWSANLAAESFQTLQDPSIAPSQRPEMPYKRLPQVTVSALRPDLPYDATANFTGEYVRFAHPTKVNGQRTIAYPQLSLPVQTSYFQFTPKLGLHVTRYAVDALGATAAASHSRSIPVFSVDTGLVFERQFDFLGRKQTQTLEPRLFYTYIPNKDQSRLPVFDTALADFNFAQIFSENRYSGGDRIGDANQLSAVVTSRLIDPETGRESVRALIGQRYYFNTQQVTLPANGPIPAEVARTRRTADLLAAVSGELLPKTYLDTGWQYNPRDHRTERVNLAGRYQPETAKVLNAGYRFTRDQLAAIDVSGQWPLFGGWHGVGRYNYSTRERRVIESVAGLEYQADCWVARFVVQRVATVAQNSTTAFFVQLELNGFSRIGSNPLDVLKRNIPGYGLINQPIADPVFGIN